MDISFDPEKDDELIGRRGIGFEEVMSLFLSPYYVEPNDTPYEGQWKAVGFVDRKLWTLIYEDLTDDIGPLRWLVTFWPSDKVEQERYFKNAKG